MWPSWRARCGSSWNGRPRSSSFGCSTKINSVSTFAFIYVRTVIHICIHIPNLVRSFSYELNRISGTTSMISREHYILEFRFLKEFGRVKEKIDRIISICSWNSFGEAITWQNFIGSGTLLVFDEFRGVEDLMIHAIKLSLLYFVSEYCNDSTKRDCLSWVKLYWLCYSWGRFVWNVNECHDEAEKGLSK